MVFFDCDFDGVGYCEGEFIFGVFYCDFMVVDCNGYVCGNVDGKLFDLRYFELLYVGENFFVYVFLFCLMVGEEIGGGG